MTVPLRVLIVDDDPDIRAITELALRLDARWVTRAVASVREARNVLASDWRIDVILADMSMPNGSGLDLVGTSSTEGATRTPPVVLFTASAREQDRSRFAAAGAIGVIAKPFDPLTLGDELRRILTAH